MQSILGPDNKGNGLLLNSTGPKIMLERDTYTYEIHKAVLRELLCKSEQQAWQMLSPKFARK